MSSRQANRWPNRRHKAVAFSSEAGTDSLKKTRQNNDPEPRFDAIETERRWRQTGRFVLHQGLAGQTDLPAF
jgi:hypothetical protein